MKSILDRSFKYTPSASTDVRKTFERVRQQLQANASPNKVLTMKQARKGAQNA
jgi:hypothetical protein